MKIQDHTAEANPIPSLAERRAFMELPLAERRRQLAEQAAWMAEQYEVESEVAEREEWQGGDIVEL